MKKLLLSAITIILLLSCSEKYTYKAMSVKTGELITFTTEYKLSAGENVIITKSTFPLRNHLLYGKYLGTMPEPFEGSFKLDRTGELVTYTVNYEQFKILFK